MVSDTAYGLFPAWIESIGSRALPTFTTPRAPHIDVLTPGTTPDPREYASWAFPDNEAGVVSAVEQGATYLWAKTIVFGSHPLQTSTVLGKHPDSIKVVSQPPLLVELFNDRILVNNMLRRTGGFSVPWGCIFSDGPGVSKTMQEANLPSTVVAKPIRGWGSHTVKVCKYLDGFVDHARSLFSESSQIMVEEFLAGVEATVTAVPPTQGGDTKYWALPVVTRFNHQDGIAPYNGVVAVTSNSRAEYDRIWQTWPRGSGQLDFYRCPGSGLGLFGLAGPHPWGRRCPSRLCWPSSLPRNLCRIRGNHGRIIEYIGIKLYSFKDSKCSRNLENHAINQF